MEACIFILHIFILLPSFFWDTNAHVVDDASLSKTNSYIVFLSEKPAGLSPEKYHMGVLSSVLGSEEAAKEALIYSYSIISGFSAKLNDEQVDRLKKDPRVVYVEEDSTYFVDDPINNGRIDEAHR